MPAEVAAVADLRLADAHAAARLLSALERAITRPPGEPRRAAG
jgi:hypothetical protein